MYKVKVGEKVYKITENDGVYEINGRRIHPKIIKTDTDYVLVLDNKVVMASVVEKGDDKNWVLEIDGQKLTTELKDNHDLLLEQMGLDQLISNKVDNVKAPMPGLVLDLMVEPGAEVKKGDPLLVLEAMKMENVIKAAADGTVKALQV